MFFRMLSSRYIVGSLHCGGLCGQTPSIFR